MNQQKRTEIFNDKKNGILPDRFPMDVTGYVEYRKDIYHLGEPEYQVEKGEVGVSADGKKRFTKDGGVWNLSCKEKYHSYEDVLNVDLLQFVIEKVNNQMLNEMQHMIDEKAKTHVPVPWHYGTLLSRCEIEFGWEPLLEASAIEPEKFSKVLDRFALSSLSVVDGWSRLDDVSLIIVHDDIAATRSLIWSPAYLRKYIFPWYKRIFDKIHENGKKVLYITDGNYAEIIDDLLQMGVDGLYCESSSIDPLFVTEKGGPDLFYLIKTDSKIMDYGTKEEILEEVLKLKSIHLKNPRIFSYIGGGTVNPSNLDAFNEFY
ncbi:MAG: hypothetical protein JXQ23_08090, partial [Clostridia bacterium]|nr:hypothetical protein [Clostridia bacterium]